MSILIRGGTVVDPVDGQYRADVLIEQDRIAAIEAGGMSATGVADRAIDADGLLVLPGGIDAHSHADARIFDDDVQLALLRSGVTTVITGQDGVSFAPGDGRYATDYFGPLNGPHPRYRGGGVAELLSGYDAATRLNLGYLLPGGTIRHEVMGSRPESPSVSELDAMVAMVRDGLSAGALGLSTGLDYVPGAFADAAELAALCRPVAAAGGIYVSHIRGYEENAPAGVAELIDICRGSGVRAHVSHFHARPDLVAQLVDRARADGVDLSWDAYPYFFGFTLLSMVLLPKQLVMAGNTAAAARLRDPANLPDLEAEFAARVDTDTNLGPGWADRVRIADAGSPQHADLEGLSLGRAGAVRGMDPLRLGYQVLADSGLAATTVMGIPQPRTDDDLAAQFRLPGACSGSDGIFFGGAPHPRAYGCCARMYSLFGRQRADLDWPQLAMITSGRAAERFALTGRGRVSAGAAADLVLLDPTTVRDRADYHRPRQLSEGIDQVLVGGRLVLDGGGLTDELAGRSLRRTGPGAAQRR